MHDNILLYILNESRINKLFESKTFLTPEGKTEDTSFSYFYIAWREEI
jgi:hypothetical protein